MRIGRLLAVLVLFVTTSFQTELKLGWILCGNAAAWVYNNQSTDGAWEGYIDINGNRVAEDHGTISAGEFRSIGFIDYSEIGLFTGEVILYLEMIVGNFATEVHQEKILDCNSVEEATLTPSGPTPTAEGDSETPTMTPSKIINLTPSATFTPSPTVTPESQITAVSSTSYWDPQIGAYRQEIVFYGDGLESRLLVQNAPLYRGHNQEFVPGFFARNARGSYLTFYDVSNGSVFQLDGKVMTYAQLIAKLGVPARSEDKPCAYCEPHSRVNVVSNSTIQVLVGYGDYASRHASLLSLLFDTSYSQATSIGNQLMNAFNSAKYQQPGGALIVTHTIVTRPRP